MRGEDVRRPRCPSGTRTGLGVAFGVLAEVGAVPAVLAGGLAVPREPEVVVVPREPDVAGAVDGDAAGR